MDDHEQNVDEVAADGRDEGPEQPKDHRDEDDRFERVTQYEQSLEASTYLNDNSTIPDVKTLE